MFSPGPATKSRKQPDPYGNWPTKNPIRIITLQTRIDQENTRVWNFALLDFSLHIYTETQKVKGKRISEKERFQEEHNSSLSYTFLDSLSPFSSSKFNLGRWVCHYLSCFSVFSKKLILSLTFFFLIRFVQDLLMGKNSTLFMFFLL